MTNKSTTTREGATATTKAARNMRKLFPVGSRFEVRASGWRGTVVGHIFQGNAQGGLLKVEYDRESWTQNKFATGKGRIGPICVKRVN